MNTLSVIKMGHPNLRKIASPVPLDQLQSPRYQEFIDHLINTMRAEDGAGIAAPQVDVVERIFVMEVDNNPRYPDKPSFPLLVAINPEIKPIGTKQVESWEGCLSIPNIRGKLMRWAQVKITGYDRDGHFFEKELSDFAAVVAQHELDHLNGILFIDRMKDMKSLCFQAEYERFYL